jgi:predicted nucleotidyltransferase
VAGSFIKDLREKPGDEMLSVSIFGSEARGDFYKDSDIDIFILVKENRPDIRGKLTEVTTGYDIEYSLHLSPVLHDLFESEKNRELGSFFLGNI